MDSEHIALSTTLLLAVLGGMTYEAAGRDHGMTRTAVERRVKAFVLRLVRDVGVEGLNKCQVKFVRKLRARRDAIEAALARFVPSKVSPSPTRPVILTDEDIQQAVRRVRLRTSTPERDVAMVWILLATGMRPLEVARIEVADYLNEDGTVRTKSEVRGCVAENGRPRPLYFSSAVACDAIDDYLATRHGRGAGKEPVSGRLKSPYRGLDPRAALFLAQPQRGFLVESIPLVSGTRSLCQEIHYAYRKIFRRIGIPGLSAQKVRYTVMDRLLRRGAHRREIGELLGVREPRPPIRPRTGLDELMDGLV